MSSAPEDVDQLFHILSHRRRRQLLVTFSEQFSTDGSQHDLGQLSETIAPDGTRERFELEMVHCHLPKLDNLGYIRWDRDDGTIARGPKWTVLEPLLDLLDDFETESIDHDGITSR